MPLPRAVLSAAANRHQILTGYIAGYAVGLIVGATVAVWILL